MEINDTNLDIVRRFVLHCKSELGITGPINIKLRTKKFEKLKTAGVMNPGSGTITVVVSNRAIADCLRTIAHELTHYRQHQDGVEFPNDDEGLQPYEDTANIMSGRLVRFWGRKNPEIYADL